MGFIYSLLMFALFEDVLFLDVLPQVPFASLSSPAVMDIRRRRRRFGKRQNMTWQRFLELNVNNIYAKVQLLTKHSSFFSFFFITFAS
mgnify:FL=1